MDCKRAQDCMERYIDGSIADYELEGFIQHIRGCSVCREELEIYYIIDLAKNLLEEDKDTSYNIAQIVEDDMNARLAKKQRRKNLKIFLFFVYFALLCLVILGICMLLGYL